MLISFSISNFMSIGSKQTLSMIPSLPTSPKKHMLRVDERELLKHAVIFGANSSGKSNFLRAMAFGKQIVLAGLSPKFKFAYSKLGDDSQPRITTWEYTFFINHHFFSYGFSVNFNTLEIVEEWLLEIDPQTDHSHLLFERHVAEQSFYSPINNYHLAGSDVKAKMLLVSDYHRHSQISVLATVYQWFAK
ncbi:MAG TPA: AAA family ATPase, partial [Bacilli bacterium]|nr:AAA family ATPase [Bacilli bacterium]